MRRGGLLGSCATGWIAELVDVSAALAIGIIWFVKVESLIGAESGEKVSAVRRRERSEILATSERVRLCTLSATARVVTGTSTGVVT